ncbi:hypothetical protein PZA11_006100 [Diplocarpon coronariae]|nr:hypothetical protein JHW43_001619 [Diplocarpon mali]
MNSSVYDFPAKPPLPPGFHSIEEVHSLPNEQVRAGFKISIIGFVKDYQPPIETSRGDFKCTLEIMDASIQNYTHGIKFSIFWPVNHMPIISESGSIVLIRNAKVQMYIGSISLLTHWSTQVHVLRSLKTSDVQWQSYPPKKTRPPDSAENNYVTWLKSQAQHVALPSTQDFQDQAIHATNIREKFSLLKSLKPNGKFHDILGEVVKIYDPKSFLTVYVSDYTSNPKFYNYSSNVGEEASIIKDGDEHGYIKARSKTEQSWPGPFGRQTIQITVYDEHADFMRDNATVGRWVHLKNVQMKLGRDGGKLEGFMRGDKGKINVRLIEPSDNPDERWKDALRRKKDYLKKFESQKGQGITDEIDMGNKRKSENDEPSKLNSKQRRKERREAARRAAAELEARVAKKLDLNDNIRCAHPEIETVRLKDILRPEMILREGASAIPSPFTVRKYRANVRVVDYAPNRIEDFAVWFRETDFDMLSDNSVDEETDDEADMRSYRIGKGFADKKWEWRFWLQVEEASTKGAKERLWVIVDNHAAQGLLNFEDEKMDMAKNLRKDHNLLIALKEQLFKLWGDLEEQKSEMLPPLEVKDTPTPSSFESTTDILPRKIGAQPDVDSEAEDENDSPDTGVGTSDKQTLVGLNPKNKAFTCCIRQYGIKEAEEDPAKANAGNGRRWQRMFGLFGTQIM